MASRKSKSRWLFRDLPRSYIVLGIAAAGAGSVAVNIYWSSPPPVAAAAAIAQPTKAELDRRYSGAIIVPTDQPGICLTVLLDNRNGHLTGGGYAKCMPDTPRKVEVEKEPEQQTRLRALGAAFRR